MQILFNNYTEIHMEMLPRWLSGKKSAYQCRRHAFDPWSRKVQHAVEQLSLHTSATEPVRQSPGAATAEPT